MKTNLYVIRDMVAAESGPIFEAKNDALALRNFQHVMLKVAKSDDYRLYCIGTYDHDLDRLEVTDLVEVMLENELLSKDKMGVSNE